MMERDPFERPRDTFVEFTDKNRDQIREAAANSIHEWISQAPDDAADVYLEMVEKIHGFSAVLEWSGVHVDMSDEEIEDTLGFWPFKPDPIPFSEVC